MSVCYSTTANIMLQQPGLSDEGTIAKDAHAHTFANLNAHTHSVITIRNHTAKR